MLGTLCSRSKPWIVTAQSFTHGAAFNRFTTNQTSFLGIRAGSEIYHRNHSTSCRIENKCVGTASIWHAIFPSFREHRNHNLVHPFHHEQKGEGSWNVAWDVRPARWLHSYDSAWLLFGACACLAPLDSCGENLEANKCIDESFLGNVRCLEDIFPTEETTNLKYRVIGVTGDGRCLFRAVSYGACMKSGEEPDENRQMELADDLRARVVNELLKRRQETEWIIEGDFDMYVNSIQRPNAWGGEPELLMASHVLRVPISVYMIDRSSGDLVNIAKYGHEYGKEESPIQVLFHGYGHYDVLEIFEDNLPAEVKDQ